MHSVVFFAKFFGLIQYTGMYKASSRLRLLISTFLMRMLNCSVGFVVEKVTLEYLSLRTLSVLPCHCLFHQCFRFVTVSFREWTIGRLEVVFVRHRRGT
jgi:hypothetical protein